MGYASGGFCLLCVILCTAGWWPIISNALEKSAKSKAGLTSSLGTNGTNQQSPAWEARYGPLVFYRGANESEVECDDVFKGLSKAVMAPGNGWGQPLNPPNKTQCKEFNGVDGETCEIELKKDCKPESQPGFCGLIQAVAIMEYPTCKVEGGCNYPFASFPWSVQPHFVYRYDSDFATSAFPFETCLETTRTFKAIRGVFWQNAEDHEKDTNTQDNTTYRRLFWASLWALAIAIGCGVASCMCGDSAGGNPGQEDVGAELMS